MDPQENLEPESRFELWCRSFDEAALDFGRLCLLRPESYITHDDDADRLHLGGSNPIIIGEHCAKITAIEYDDIADVLPVVTHWCRINCVLFAVYFDPEGFHCAFQDRATPPQVFETKQHENLCGLLLMGCVAVARSLDRVLVPDSGFPLEH